MKPLQTVKRAFMQTFYPQRCVCCGKLIEEDEKICIFCRRWIERVNTEKRCLRCGYEKKNCKCGQYTFHFERIIAPFYNIGLAQRGFYRLKFQNHPSFAVYFAEEMARCIREEYYGFVFSGICYVPTSRRHLYQRGFDQSEELARELSKILKLPLYTQALIHCIGGKTQHKLDKQARFEAIRGQYKTGMRLSGRILLVDDIMTTGATLDECARELLFAGADEVDCVTVLISGFEQEIQSEYTRKVCNLPRKAVEKTKKM